MSNYRKLIELTMDYGSCINDTNFSLSRGADAINLRSCRDCPVKLACAKVALLEEVCEPNGLNVISHSERARINNSDIGELVLTITKDLET